MLDFSKKIINIIYKKMFNHNKKLCYLVYPKSGSSSMRDYLPSKGFAQPLGRWGHTDMKHIEQYAQLHKINLDEYTFFSTFRDPISHFISCYNWTQNDPKWNGGISGTNIKINSPNDYLNYLENRKYKWNDLHPYLFSQYKNFFRGINNKVKNVLMLDLKPETLQKFCKKYGIEYSPLPHSNKTIKKNSINLNDNEIKRIHKLYESNENYIKNHLFI